ncbi:MAG: AbiH family protein [Candidatus Microsaccharimonas sp.]
MTNVSFIVGNGLDLSLGMETSYREFYEYVKQKRLHPENRIYKAIQESPESWADFELSLGNYTRYIEKVAEKDRKNESVQLHNELAEIMEDLAEYLENQEAAHEEGVEAIEFSASDYYQGLPSGQHQKISALLPSNQQTNIDFVTLNYTKTLEKILSENRIRLRRYGINLGNPHHLHGDLAQDMTLGVSDESQISEAMTGAERDDLIKPSLIYSMNDGRIEMFQRLIANSTIIVLFGTSIGDTDKYIWEIVTKWLSNSTDRAVIIHAHDSSYTGGVRRNSRMQKQYISNVQEKLLRHSGLDGDSISTLRSQIFVIHNTQSLFRDS